MSASSSFRPTSPTNTPSSCNYAAYPMHDEEDMHYNDDSDSESDAPSTAPDFYDIYQRQRHDHYVALLEPIMRGEASAANNDKENQDPDAIDSDDEDLGDAESDASDKENTVTLGKRSGTDGSIIPSAKRARVDVATDDGSGDLTTDRTSSSAPTDEATRLRIILSTVPETKRTRAHLEAFYSSLQPGPKQLQLLGELESKKLSKEERVEYLKADEWVKAGSIQRWEVVCAGCDGIIVLEKPRSDAQMENGSCEFYPGNWNKHRNGCAEVYRKWCERNGLVADEGTGTAQKSGKKKAKKAKKETVKGMREVKSLPTRAIARRTSLASIPVNTIA